MVLDGSGMIRMLLCVFTSFSALGKPSRQAAGRYVAPWLALFSRTEEFIAKYGDCEAGAGSGAGRPRGRPRVERGEG